MRLPIDVSIFTKEVTTTFRHRESKHSGHSIESEKPNLYEIYCPQESTEFRLSLIVVLEQVIENIEKHVILHFDFEKDIPCIFDMAFKMMGILEKMTNMKNFKRLMVRKSLLQISGHLEGSSIQVWLLFLIEISAVKSSIFQNA